MHPLTATDQTPSKSVMQPKGERLFTTETLFLLLNKVPPAAREANRTQGIKTSHLCHNSCWCGLQIFLSQNRMRNLTQWRNHLPKADGPSNSALANLPPSRRRQQSYFPWSNLSPSALGPTHSSTQEYPWMWEYLPAYEFWQRRNSCYVYVDQSNQ